MKELCEIGSEHCTIAGRLQINMWKYEIEELSSQDSLQIMCDECAEHVSDAI